jgi:ABC-2 type transport system permease protein
MFAKLFAIARNTFLETIRQPVYNVLLWVGAGLLMINPSLAGFSLEHEGDIKIVMDVGLATLLLYGLLASVFSATNVITREIETQTVLTVVSKPVARPVFLLGKYLGVATAILLGYYFLCLTLLMTVRHGVMATAADAFDWPVLVLSGTALLVSLLAAVFSNYFYGWHFPATLLGWVVPAGTVALLMVLFLSPKWEFQSPLTDFGDMQMIYAVAMTACGVLILSAVAVTLSTRFSQMITLLLASSVYVLGLLADHFFGAPDSALHMFYYVVPNFQFFWAGDALTQEQFIPAMQVGRVAAYAGLYALAVLSLGIALFQTREVG